jgi:hypothetical protein
MGGGGEIVVRQIVQMSFVFDHRVCDGGTAARFMRLMADAVEQPSAAIGHRDTGAQPISLMDSSTRSMATHRDEPFPAVIRPS